MIFSAQQLFSSDQAVTVAAVSTNVIDTGVAGTPYGAAAALNKDIGKGNKIPLLVQVTTAFATGAGATTLTIAVETGATTALGTVIHSETIAIADLVAGKQINLDFLPNGVTERYLGLRYTPDAAMNAGAITAGICMGVQTNVTGA